MGVYSSDWTTDSGPPFTSSAMQIRLEERMGGEGNGGWRVSEPVKYRCGEAEAGGGRTGWVEDKGSR